MAAIFRMWQVQATLSGKTPDGWDSSRSTPTMLMASPNGLDAVRAVSHMGWDFTPRAYVAGRKVTIASVVEIDRNGLPIGDPQWVRVTYAGGSIETVSASTYAALKQMKEFDPYKENGNG